MCRSCRICAWRSHVRAARRSSGWPAPEKARASQYSSNGVEARAMSGRVEVFGEAWQFVIAVGGVQVTEQRRRLQKTTLVSGDFEVPIVISRSEEHTSELQSRLHL